MDKLANHTLVITQGYLNKDHDMAMRIRSSRLFLGSVNQGMKFMFAFKKKVEKRLIEIESPVERNDFYDLWPSTIDRVFKTRFVILNEKEIWEVDFFEESNHDSYFCMAEVELPEGQLSPVSIPSFISDNLLYEVPVGNAGFSSRELSNHDYAELTLKRLENGKICSKK
jgi:CYTH domain-containing protein